MPAAVNYTNSRPNIDRYCGTNTDLATSTICAGANPNVRGTTLVVGKSGKSAVTGFVTQVSQLSSRVI
jgi:cell shape-determining protein MreC